MTNVVTIGDRNFQVRKLPTYPDQMLLAKAVMPLWQDLMPLIIRVITTPELREAIKNKKVPPEFMIEFMDTAFTALRKMSDDDMLNLSQRALVAVQIQHGGSGWSNLMADGQLMHQTLDLSDIITLIYKVAEANLGGFFSESLGMSQGQKATE